MSGSRRPGARRAPGDGAVLDPEAHVAPGTVVPGATIKRLT